MNYEFGYIIDSNIKRIRLYIRFIRKYDEEIAGILESLQVLVDSNEDTDFVKQIHLIETFKGAGFLSAVSLMGEIGDFSAFNKPKQLFAYFGLDPAVKQSGKFEGTKVQMSKRGSAIARRVIHVLPLQSISISRNGKAKNPVLRDYYLKKCESKPKLVAMGAVSHKVCNTELPEFISFLNRYFHQGISAPFFSQKIKSIFFQFLIDIY